MTLIAAIHNDGEPSFLLADVALSFGGPPIDTGSFPLQQTAESGYFDLPEIENRIISGNSQKMFFWDNHAIQWAGRYVVAISILRFLKSNSKKTKSRNFFTASTKRIWKRT